jgi:hypothetical protein
MSLPNIELGPVDRRGNTPLWDAIVDGNYEMANCLRSDGAPIQDGVAEYICQAVSEHKSGFVELLLKVGVSMDLKVRSHHFAHAFATLRSSTCNLWC